MGVADHQLDPRCPAAVCLQTARGAWPPARELAQDRTATVAPCMDGPCVASADLALASGISRPCIRRR
jgi:hypothetical protein